MEESGTFQKLMSAGAQFATMMKEVQVDEEEHEDTSKTVVVAAAAGPTAASGVGDTKAAAAAPPDAAGAKLTSEETTAEGSLSAAVIMQFVDAMGGRFWLVWIMLSYLVVEAIRVATTVCLSIGTGTTDEASGDGAADSRKAMFYLVRCELRLKSDMGGWEGCKVSCCSISC